MEALVFYTPFSHIIHSQIFTALYFLKIAVDSCFDI